MKIIKNVKNYIFLYIHSFSLFWKASRGSSTILLFLIPIQALAPAALIKIAQIMLDNPISPESFEGSDLEKIQQALDLAVIENRPLRLGRIYDITGLGSIMLNKGVMDENRSVTYISGGGIEKHDRGYIFDSVEADIGDLNITGVKYVSTEGAGVTVFNANKLIRINSHGNDYMNIDTVAEASGERFFQTMRFVLEHIVGGNGDAFSFVRSYDTVIQNTLIEHRENGVMNQPYETGKIANFNLRIKDNVFEGLTGVAIQLGSSIATSIENNYLETNIIGDIDLATLNNHQHYSLTISKNMISVHRDRKEQGAIKVKNVFTGSTSGSDKNEEFTTTQGSSLFSGNVALGSRLYDYEGTGTLFSIGDREDIQSPPSINIIRLDGVSRIEPFNPSQHSMISQAGLLRGFQLEYTFTLPPSNTRSFNIPVNSNGFAHPVKNEDMIAIYPKDGLPSSDQLLINAYRPIHVSTNKGELRIKATNLEAAENEFTVVVNIWKMFS